MFACSVELSNIPTNNETETVALASLVSAPLVADTPTSYCIECSDQGNKLWHCWSPCPGLSQSWGLKIASFSHLSQESKI